MGEVSTFLKSTVLGLLFLGIIANLLTSLIKYILLKTSKFLKNYFDNKIIERVQEILGSYYEGALCRYAKKSSFHQAALIGRYILIITTSYFQLIFIFLIMLILLIIISKEYQFIVAIITGVLINTPIEKIRKTNYYYKKLINHLFHKEKLKKELISYADKYILNLRNKKALKKR